MSGNAGTPSKALWVFLGAFVGLLMFMAACAIGLSGGSSHNNGLNLEVKRKYAIETCQGAIRKGLRDPDSARFTDETALDAPAPPVLPGGLAYAPNVGDTYLAVSGMVNAKNGFGGYTGPMPYTCDAVVAKSGTTDVRARQTR